MPSKEVNIMIQRTEFALRAVQSGESFRHLCREYGISAKTGYKWRERFLQSGLDGLQDLSRRPQSSPRELAEGVVCEMVRLKQAHRAWGPKKIRAIYQRVHGGAVPSESSFKRVLDRAGLVEPRRLRPRSEAGRLFSGRLAHEPNEIWTADFKGHWYDKNRRRCEPLTIRDEFSRYVLELRAVPNAQSQTVRQCFEQLFERHGLPAAIRSDNGVPFASAQGVLGLSRLSAWWVVLGIDLERSRPGCPQDNPAHERLHLDVRLELQDLRPEVEQAGFDEWRHTFNYERPHEALKMRCPGEIYHPSRRRYEGTPADLSYPTMESKKVAECGTISWGKRRWIFISGALAGWSVGLEPGQAGLWHVWFGRLLLGTLDEKALCFRRTEPPAKTMATSSKGVP